MQQPAGSAQALRAASVVRTDFDVQDQCYVFQVVPSLDGRHIAASLSNRSIKLYAYDNSSVSLSFAGELKGHEQAITQIACPLPDAPHALYSSSADGTVRGWDMRSHQEVERFKSPWGELHCLGVAGNLVAGGGNERVLFWDRRTGKQAGLFQDMHSDEVTQVKFHPERPGMLVTGSTDGLIAVFNVSGGKLDEDEAFKAAINMDNSVTQLGFYGPGLSRAWIHTGTEGLLLWQWEAACQEDAPGGAGPFAILQDARPALTEAAAAAGPAASAALAPQLDYLVSCEYNAAAGQLWALAGTNAGAVGLFPVAEPGAEGPPAAPGFGAPAAVLQGGHNDVVRSVLWPGASGPICISGGEDARIIAWAPDSVLGASTPSSLAAPTRREGEGKPKKRPSPY